MSVQSPGPAVAFAGVTKAYAGGTIADNYNTYAHEIDTGVTLSGGATITSSGSSARLIFNTSAINGHNGTVLACWSLSNPGQLDESFNSIYRLQTLCH